MATDTIAIQPKRTVATLIVAAGSGPTLVTNTDLLNTVFLGDTDGIHPGDPQGVVPLGPNGSVTVDGNSNLYAVNGNTTAVTIATLTGGLSNFLGLTQGMGALAIPSIFSPNFVTGVSGWSIQKTGNAEFNNLTIRGTFLGLDFIINSSGIFFYSGVPATGNLFMYWAVVAGTDAFNNTFFQGLFVGNPATGPQVTLVQQAGGASLQFPVFPASFFSQIANITAENLSSSGQVFFSGPALAQVGFTDWVQIALRAFQGSTPAHADTIYVDANAVAHVYESVSFFGSEYFAVRQLFGVHPGTGTSNTNVSVQESWQTPSLINGWTTGGPITGGIRYRFIPLGAGMIEIEGDIFNAGAVGNSICAVFAAPYITVLAAKTRNIPSTINQSLVNNSPSTPWIFIDNAGNINVIGYQAGGKELFFHGFIPLD